MKRPSKSHLAVALAASTVAMGINLAPSSDAATPFDGDFETPAVAGSFANRATGPTLGAWSVTSGSVDQIGTLWDGAGPGKDQSVDLNGAERGSICQNTTTVPGGTYEVRFSMSQNPTPGPASMGVYHNGLLLGNQIYDEPNTTADMMWSERTASFVAPPNGMSRICFLSNDDGTHGPALDEVSVTLLNTPPTASITSPAENQQYFQGQTATYSFGCSDVDNNLSSCVGSDGATDGGPVDTATPGAKSLTVTATDEFGATGIDVNHYVVNQLFAACRGLAVGLPLGIRLGDANPAKNPCVTKNATATNINTPLIIGSLNVTALNSTTEKAPNGVQRAAAGLSKATLSVLGMNITAENLQSQVEAKMGPGCTAVTKSGSSTVGKVTVNGTVLTDLGGGAGTSIPILFGLATLHVNQEISVGNTITRRALFLDMPGDILDVVIGQSSVGSSCDEEVQIASVIERTKKPTKAEVDDLKRQIREAVAKDKAAKGERYEKPASDVGAEVEATERKGRIQNA